MNRFKQTLRGSAFAPWDRRFRLMKAPDGEHGGGDGGGSGNSNENNPEGNSDGGGNDSGSQNNAGDNFDAGSFWNQPSSETDGGTGNGGSASPNDSGGGQDNGGSEFVNQLNSTEFGTNVFTPEAVEAMNNNDPSQFHKNMTEFGRSVMRESVLMAARLMQRHAQIQEQKFGEMMDGKFGQRDTESNLSKEFPSYNQPGMKPVIDGIHAQSLRLAGGDSKKAISMTKAMLRHSAELMGSDFNLTTPPGGAGDRNGQPQTDWAEELLGRS